MWVYSQSNGLLTHNCVPEGYGYSGCGDCKNDPAEQNLQNEGPIPRGKYTIGESFADLKLGPIVMPLTPMDAQLMNGRSGFYIHGDSIERPGDASHGCIILGHNLRLLISLSFDRNLEVVA